MCLLFLDGEDEVGSLNVKENKFVPIVSLDTSFKKDSHPCTYLGSNNKTTTLGEEIENREQPLEIIKFTRETTIRLNVTKGNTIASLDEGDIFLLSNQIDIFSVFVCKADSARENSSEEVDSTRVDNPETKKMWIYMN